LGIGEIRLWSWTVPVSLVDMIVDDHHLAASTNAPQSAASLHRQLAISHAFVERGSI